MLCENCHNATATTHIKSAVNGVLKEYHLCSSCASKLGLSNFNMFDLNELWGSLLGNQKEINLNTKKCNNCNSTFNEIAKSGKMGCPECYKVFRDEIIPTLIKIHGKSEHKGIVPEAFAKRNNDKNDEIKKLETDLKTAIENEEYEKAAEIRDTIKLKKGEINE